MYNHVPSKKNKNHTRNASLNKKKTVRNLVAQFVNTKKNRNSH